MYGRKKMVEVKCLRTLVLESFKTLQKVNPVFMEARFSKSDMAYFRPSNMPVNAPNT